MISKQQVKFISSLQQKKNRKEHQLFVVEGVKITEEIFNSSFKIHSLYAIDEWITLNKTLLKNISAEKVFEISEKELAQISGLSQPNQVVAVLEVPVVFLNTAQFKDELTLVLDNIQDPGNLGTIIRVADWFGIKNIVCSNDCVEVYNPKVVQATMGSFLRINVFYEYLNDFFSVYKEKFELPVYGAMLEGLPVYDKKLNNKGFLLLGNESKGISEGLEKYIDEKILIPPFGKAESLNVAIASAVLCYEFRRQSVGSRQ